MFCLIKIFAHTFFVTYDLYLSMCNAKCLSLCERGGKARARVNPNPNPSPSPNPSPKPNSTPNPSHNPNLPSPAVPF